MSTADIIVRLDELRLRSKYVDEPGTLYSGMPPEYDRQLAETQLNDLLDNLKHRLSGGLTKQFVRDQCAKTLSLFESGETEDRERLCDYLAEIMDIVGTAIRLRSPLSTMPAGIIVPTFPQRSPPRLLDRSSLRWLGIGS